MTSIAWLTSEPLGRVKTVNLNIAKTPETQTLEVPKGNQKTAKVSLVLRTLHDVLERPYSPRVGPVLFPRGLSVKVLLCYSPGEVRLQALPRAFDSGRSCGMGGVQPVA